MPRGAARVSRAGTREASIAGESTAAGSTAGTEDGANMDEDQAMARETGPVIAEAAGRRGSMATAAIALALTAWAAGAEVEVVVSNGGFRPAQLTVRKGETLRLRLVASDVEHCFAIDALRIEKRVVPGKRSLVELVPDKAGTFPFHCCLEPGNEALRGRLVVSE